MTATVITREPAPDLRAIKGRQQATWASGDYHMIGTQIVLVSELLIEALDVHSTERVLDVATGSGNAALAAARRGCEAVGIDYVPALLRRARRRADAEGLVAEFRYGDAENLPVHDGASMSWPRSSGRCSRRITPRPRASSFARTRPGGRIGLVAHTPEGFIGQLFKTNARHVPPPAGVASPILWGTEAHLRDLFGDAIAETQRGQAPRTRSGPRRRRASSTTGAGSTARRSRPSRRSGPPARTRSRPTCSTSSRPTTAPTTARWSCRTSTSKRSS